MNIFNQMCSTIRRTLNYRTRKDTQIKFYKAMAVPILTYGSEISTITKKKQEGKTETAEMKFLRSVARLQKKDQTRNTKITEEQNIFNLNNKIPKSRSQCEYQVL
jgi:hypothetical protein